MRKLSKVLLLLAAGSLWGQEELFRYDGVLPAAGYTVDVRVPKKDLMRLNILAVSPDFTPKIQAGFPDGSAETYVSTGMVTSGSSWLSKEGTVRITVGAQSTPGTGAKFALRVKLMGLGAALNTAEVQGALGAFTAETGDSNRLVSWHPLRVKANERWQISMTSEFDNYLQVRLPNGQILEDDDSGNDSNARLTVKSPVDGVVLVGATNYDKDLEDGAYKLKAIALPPPVAMSIGRAVNGRLRDESPELTYGLGVKAGSRYELTLDSDDFDPKVAVLMPGRDTLEDDDGGDENNSYLKFTADQNGQIDITVSAAGDSLGAFTLTVKELPPPPAISLGRAVNGDVSEDDEKVGDGEKTGDAYSLPVRKGRLYLATVESVDDLDPYLYVEAPGSGLSKNDDVGEDNTDSELIFFAADDGSAIVSVGGVDSTGGYVLKVVEYTGTGGLKPYTGASDLAIPGVYFTNADGRSAEHEYRLLLPVNRVVVIDLKSGGFDTMLKAVSPSGEVFEDDDSGANTDSRLELQGDGKVWTIQVSDVGDENMKGLYSIGVTLGPERISLARFTGTLTEATPRDLSGKAYVVHEVRLSAGTAIEVSLTSSAFDAMVILQDSRGKKLEEDDDSGSGNNAKLNYTVSQSGTYKLAVTTSGSDSDLGSYVMEVFRSED